MFSFSFEHMDMIMKPTEALTHVDMRGKAFYSMCYKIRRKLMGNSRIITKEKL